MSLLGCGGKGEDGCVLWVGGTGRSGEGKVISLGCREEAMRKGIGVEVGKVEEERERKGGRDG